MGATCTYMFGCRYFVTAESKHSESSDKEPNLIMHMHRYAIKTTLPYFWQKGNVPFLIQRNHNIIVPFRLELPFD